MTDQKEMRDKQIQTISLDQNLQKKLLQLSRRRIRRVRKALGYDALPASDLLPIAEMALKFGYYQVLVQRYIKENHVPLFRLEKKRVERGLRKQDCTLDAAILVQEYPDFENYYPESSPLTQGEILKAALTEFSRAIADATSDFGHYRKRKSIVKLLADYPSFKKTLHITAPDDNVDETTIQEIIVEFSPENSHEPVSPAITKLYIHFVKVFGPTQTIYWFYEQIFFKGQYVDLLRHVGGLNDKDLKGHKLHADLRRKLREMDKELEKFIDDPEIKELYDNL